MWNLFFTKNGLQLCALSLISLSLSLLVKHQPSHTTRFRFANFITRSHIFTSTTIVNKAKSDLRLTDEESLYYPDSIELSTSEYDGLYKLFLDEISNLVAQEASADVVDLSDESSIVSKFNLQLLSKRRNLIETTTLLQVGSCVEAVCQKKLVFGNVIRSNNTTKTIDLQLSTGKGVITVDASQIISCWDMVSDDKEPSTALEWAKVTSEALQILGKMSPRKSDLREFYEIAGSQRDRKIAVDSLDLGVYIFQERKFRAWMNPSLDAAEARVQALSAAQRYVAALLLFYDDFHFKRRASLASSHVVIDDPDDEGDANENDKGNDGWVDADVAIVEGGYNVLPGSVVMHKEGDAFEQFYLEKRKAVNNTEQAVSSSSSNTTSPYRDACILKQLRALEVYAMAPATLVPPPAVKHVLKRLSKPLSPAGAKQLLFDIRMDKSYSPSPTQDKSAVGGRAAAGGAGGVTAWTPGTVEAANALCLDIEKRRKDLTFSSGKNVLGQGSNGISKVGKKGPSGRMDYRGSSADHPVICIDSKRAAFFDDAFSLSPETGEVLVHITDVVGFLRKYDVLGQTAKERAFSTYTPSGPLHMLPPHAVDALRLSSFSANEVLTVAISVDHDSGKLLAFRIFPSVIGPVFPMDTETADEIIAGLFTRETENGSRVISSRPGFPDPVVRDLAQLAEIMDRVIKKQPWVDSHFSGRAAREVTLDRMTGTYEQALVEKTAANRMVNALLTIYSNASCTYCLDKGLDVPIAWENRDRSVDGGNGSSRDSPYIRPLDTTTASADASSRSSSTSPEVRTAVGAVRRFSTQPLRNWLSMVQQKQLRAALRLELQALSRAECAQAVAHHNRKKMQMASLRAPEEGVVGFDAFEAHCLRVQEAASSQRQGQKRLQTLGDGPKGQTQLKVEAGRVTSYNVPDVEVEVEGLGSGGKVKIVGYSGVRGLVTNVSLRKGEKLTARVKKIIRESKTVMLEA